jgi:hypothetical protein
VQEKLLQENSDPGKLCTAEGIGLSREEDDPQYKNGTAHGTRSQQIRPGQCDTGNLERTDVREETLEDPGMQNWHMGTRPKTAVTRQQENKVPRGRLPLCLRKERTTTKGTGRWNSEHRSHLGRGGTHKYLYEIFREKTEKKVVGISNGLRRMMDWTLWRD